ncbi:hypothetical protein D6D11_10667 [Aureobasidium pullulans]|nr:hypothetical protein D6D11_10667 [Aureobasidium pullulans]
MKLTWLPWLFVIIAAALVVAKPLDRDPTALTTLVTRSINTATVNPIVAKPLTSRSVAAALAKGPCESAGTITKCALKATIGRWPWKWKKNFKKCIMKCMKKHKEAYPILPPNGAPPIMPPPNQPPPNQPPPNEAPPNDEPASAAIQSAAAATAVAANPHPNGNNINDRRALSAGSTALTSRPRTSATTQASEAGEVVTSKASKTRAILNPTDPSCDLIGFDCIPRVNTGEPPATLS